MVMPQATFNALVSNSRLRTYGSRSGALTFNGVQYENVELLVHGGNPQRGTCQMLSALYIHAGD